MLYIKNATIYTPDQVIANGAVLVESGIIVAVGLASDVPCCTDAEVIDAAGLILAPGFIDLQINGAFGDDFTADPATIWRVAEGLPRYGVTAFLPTIITSPLEQVAAGQRVVTDGRTGRLPRRAAAGAACRRSVPQPAEEGRPQSEVFAAAER